MSRLQKQIINGVKIVLVDYSSLREDEVIELVSKLLELVLSGNERVHILSVYNEKNFITPRLMRHIEKVTKQSVHLIDKMAIVGLTPTKKVILKGYNLIFRKDFKAFDTQEDAIAYLITDNSL